VCDEKKRQQVVFSKASLIAFDNCGIGEILAAGVSGDMC
jgi:hypothetical protein